MEENPIEPQTPGLPTPAHDPAACENCGKPAVIDGHPTRLCPECRAQFLHYPIPIWVKLFMGGILVIAALSMFSFPKSFSISLHLERGKKAEKERRFVTEQHEMQEVLGLLPDNLEARGHLLIATEYNMDWTVAKSQLLALRKATNEDLGNDLYDQLEETLKKFENYLPGDTLNVFLNGHDLPIPDTAWNRYLSQNPDDVYALMVYAAQLEDTRQYPAADSLLQKALDKDPQNMSALRLMASIKRLEGKYDASLVCCDRILQINQESTDGDAAKVRTLLAKKREKEALSLARQTCALDTVDTYAKVSLVLALHFNGLTTERDGLIRAIQTDKPDSSAKEALQYALDVISNKEKL